MGNFLLFSLSISIFCPMTALVPLNDESGHIYKMDLEVDENISRMAIDHYGSGGKPVYKEEGEYESFSQEQVQNILVNFDEMLTTISGKSSVSHEPAKVSLSNKFGNIGSNALGKSKMPYFPKNKLKKVKVTADASDYEVGEKWFEISRAPIVSGGQKEKVGDTPAMNVHEDEFWPLTLDEIQSCIEVAFAKTLQV